MENEHNFKAEFQNFKMNGIFSRKSDFESLNLVSCLASKTIHES